MPAGTDDGGRRVQDSATFRTPRVEPRAEPPAPWWPVLLIAAAGGALRLAGLGRESLWVDEGYTASLVRLGPAAYIDNVLHTIRNILPPLYFALMHYWTALAGTSEVALRLPSALAGTAAIVLIHRVALAGVGRRAALIAAVLLAFSPFHLWFSQEARPYELLALLYLASLHLLVTVLAGPGAMHPTTSPVTSPVIGLGVIDALMLYTHHHATMLIAAQVVYVAVRGVSGTLDRAAIRRWLTASAVGAVVSIPWLLLFLNQLGKVNEFPWLSRPTAATLYGTVVTFAGSGPALACFVVLLLAGGLSRHLGPRPDAGPYLLLWVAFLVPLLGTFTYAVFFAPVFGAKYVIATSLPLLVLVADGASRLGDLLARRARRGVPGRPVSAIAAGAAALITLAAMAPTVYAHVSRIEKEQWREVTAWVEADSAPGDLVLFNAGYTLASGFETYAHRTDLDTRPFPLDSADFATVPDGAQLGTLATLTAGRQHAWVVYSQTHDAHLTIAEALSALSADAVCHDYVGVSACRYTLR
ncbi:MAG: glycosyltransferase family 39 protein [Kineosporiaceae bacterium]